MHPAHAKLATDIYILASMYVRYIIILYFLSLVGLVMLYIFGSYRLEHFTTASYSTWPIGRGAKVVIY
jgi:hypothetical protein